MKNNKTKTMKQKLIVNTSISMSLLLLVSMLVSVFSLVLTGNERVTSQEEISRQAFDRLIQEQVHIAMSVATYYNNEYTSGKMTLGQAKVEAANVIRSMRYGQDG